MDDHSSLESHERISPPFLKSPGADAMRNRIASRLFHAEAVPVRIGNFEILEILGAGGMGVVYRARDPRLRREIALKLLHPRMVVGEREQARLMREAQALAQLSHPNVVQLFEVGRQDGQLFLCMEYVRGPTLRRWQTSDQRHWREVLGSYLQAGAGLAAAHEAGFVHRDFKPDNCIVDVRGRVRVLDFGLVRTGTEDEPATIESSPVGDEELPSGPSTAFPLTSPSTLLGTFAYMAPEQLRGRLVDARADQFSFCVALLEALCGEHPYPGDTEPERALALARADPSPPSRSRRVPASILRAVHRGLAVEPDERWPSMSALLDELERAARPRWTWWTGSLMLSTMLAVVAWGIWYPNLQRCQGAEQQFEGIWDNARAAKTAEAFRATDSPIAITTWPRIEERLGEYRERWIGKYTEACKATRIREEQSSAVMSQRMRCLNDHRRKFDAVVGVLERATPKVVLEAVDLVARLPTLERCDDLEALLADIPPPTDTQVEVRVEALRDEIERIHAALGFETIDQYRIDTLVQEAEALGYAPLIAEALAERGTVYEYDGHFKEAETDLWRAHLLAVEHGHYRIQLRANERLASVVGFRLAQHERGLRFAETTVALARHGGDEEKVAAGYNTLGLINESLGNFDLALEMHERALKILEKTLGLRHPNVGASMNNLGLVFLDQGRYAEAAATFGRALEVRRSSLGEDHPDYAQSLGNLALAYKRQGRYRESEELRRRVIDIMRNALGDQHPRVATNLDNLGGVLQAQGKYGEAEQVHRRALEIRRKVLAPGHPRIAQTLNNLGTACVEQDKREEAERYYREALEIRVDAFGENHYEVASSLGNLGELLSRRGEQVEAERLLLRALSIREKVLGPSHVLVANSLVNLAQNARRSGELEKARDWAARALEIRMTGETPPQELAEAQFLLACVLPHDQAERAYALAEGSRRIYAELGESKAKMLATIDRWLADNTP